jgi:galactokinase
MSEIAVQAPARVNLIGEHTDYNGGFVLPTTTALFTRVVAERRADQTIEVRSTHFDESRSFLLDDVQPGDEVSWIEYVKGVAAELLAAGVELQGATLEIDSDIPVGGGLSSSASLELGVAQALLAVADVSIEPERLARLCQRAEHAYANVRCGIMDQYTIACAGKGNAILLDCRSLDVMQVPIPDNARLIVTDSGVRHRLPEGDYNNRADECAAAVQLLAKVVPGLETLRDLQADVLDEHKKTLGDVLYRRCHHVVSENARVHRAVEAMDNADLSQLGTLLNDCHTSLRDDFEISCAEVDQLVAICNASDGILGSRMVGGGFGGCVLSLTTADAVGAAATQIAANYGRVLGKMPWVHVVEAADPVQVVDTR